MVVYACPVVVFSFLKLLSSQFLSSLILPFFILT